MVFTQIKNPVVIDGLIKATKGLNVAQLEAFISTNKLNVAQASAVLRSAGVSRAERIQILTNAGLITSNGSLTVSVKSVTTALLAQAAAWAATPMGKATIAAAGIFAVVKAIDYLTSATERAQKKFSEIKDEYEETTSEVESLEAELDGVQTQLDELNNADAPELVDPEEIEKLERSKELLEQQLALKRELASYEQREAAEAAEKALTAQNMYLTGGVNYTADGSIGIPEVGYRDIVDELVENKNWLAYLEKSLEQAYTDLATMEVGSKKYERQASHIEYLKEQIDDYAQTVAESKNEILELYMALLDDNGNAIEGFEGTAARVKVVLDLDEASLQSVEDAATATAKTAAHMKNEVADAIASTFINMDDYASHTKAWDIAYAQYKEYYDQYKELIAGLNDDELEFVHDLVVVQGETDWSVVEAALRKYRLEAAAAAYETRVLHKGYEDLSKEVATAASVQQATNQVFADKTYITEEAYNNLVALAGSEEALAGCIDKTNGFLVTNAAELNKLVDASVESIEKNIQLAESHEKLNYHKLTQQLHDVISGTEDYDETTLGTIRTILDQIDATELQIAKYKLLEQQLLGAANAFTELEEAQKIDSEADYTDDLSSMISSLLTSFENKEFGTEGFWTAFKALVPEDVYGQFEDVGDQIDAGWKYINNVLSKYFTYDDSGNISVGYDDAVAFANDALSTAYGDSTVFTGTIEDFQLNEQITSIEELADAMGITTTAAFALGTAISKYSADNADFLSSLSVDSLEGQIYAADQQLVELLAHQAELGENGLVGTEEWDKVTQEIRNVQTELDTLATKAREDITTHITLDADITAAQQEVDELHGKLQEMDEADPEYEATLTNYVTAEEELATLLQEKYALEAPTELTIQVALEQVQSEIDSVQSQLDTIATFDGQKYTAIAGVEQSEVDTLVSTLDTLNSEKANIQLYAGLDDTSVMESLETIENYTIKDKSFRVTANLGNTISRLQSVLYYLNQIRNTSATVNTGGSRAFGTALARGNWGIPSAERDALVGELGQELVVDPRSGMYYTVGDNGAELVNLPSGAIVFNHRQTEALFKNRRINSRGIAYARGNAHFRFLDGNYGFGSIDDPDTVTTTTTTTTTTTADEESWFERQYKDHNHWLKMDKESTADYLAWLDDAYKKAYADGVIDLDEYYKYQEEVYEGLQDSFKDHLNDIDHEISTLEAGVGNSDEIIALSLQAIQDIEAELAAARAAGLDENGDYIQYLEQQWASYSQTVIDLREQAETEAQNSIDDLVEYRIKMLKQDIENEKDALNKKLDDLQDFYDKQRKMLQDQYDEEKYLEEQKEKRKSVTDIQAELAMLENDNSAWAQKRKLELQAELSDAEKDLNSFEKDHALDMTLDMLDEQQAAQEAQIQAEMDALDEKLNDPHALFNQALEDIKNNTAELYQEFIEYNRSHGDGNDETVSDMWEEAYIADQEYQDTHDGEHLDGIEIGNYTGYVMPENPTPPQPDPNTSTPAEDNAPSEPETPAAPQLTDEIKKKVAAAIWNGGYGWGSGSTRTNRLTEVFGAGNGIQDLVNKGVGKNGVSLTSEYTYENMRKKFKGYASGTANAMPGWHEVDELGPEYLFVSPSDGTRYRMFTGGEKVLNADATNFLYDFANSGGAILTKMLADLLGHTNLGSIAKPIQAIELSIGDIVVQGSCDNKSVSEIRRAQRSDLEFFLKELNKLNK